jgi:uncharacterized membrane protein
METLLHISVTTAAIAGFLIARHIKAKKQRRELFLCPVGFDCNAVVTSKYSTFLGFHLENIGMLYYGATALVHAPMLFAPSLSSPLISLAVLATSAGAFLFSLYLTGIQLFALKQWCSWCLVSAALCVVIFVGVYTLTSGGF